ncbi:MAG TPA: hypothetical protein VFV38_18005 [Ktedonobacteraceae bacterium]|nr:hypothetical protein [Ktedonobacteraceae bacterium]
MKLFYTDQLAALIMARDFFVNVGLTAADYEAVFGDNRHDLIGEDSLIILYPHKLVELISSGYTGCSLYVLSSSYPCFRPQVGDLLLGRFPGGDLHYYLYVEEYYPGHGLQINTLKLLDFEVQKIIQRNGKPFFWPEREGL